MDKSPIERLLADSMPDMLTPQQLADVLQLGLTKTYELLRSGAVPGAYRLGPKLYRINRRVLLNTLGRTEDESRRAHTHKIG